MIETEKDEAMLEKKLKEKMAGDGGEAQVGTEIKIFSSPWFRYFLTYDPATALRKVTCPVLAINGEKDTQVPPKQNLPAIRQRPWNRPATSISRPMNCLDLITCSRLPRQDRRPNMRRSRRLFRPWHWRRWRAGF